jgi:hypothetical protein
VAAAGRRARAGPNPGVGTGSLLCMPPLVLLPPLTVRVHQQPWRPPGTNPAWHSPGNPDILSAFTQAQAHTAPAQFSDNSVPTPPEHCGWDQAGLVAALNQMSLQGSSYVLDTGATADISSSASILLSHLPPPSGITVGNGTTIPITCRGTSTLSSPTSIYHLNNVLVATDLVRNLLSVHQFTRDNACSIEFDACGFSVKDQQTGHVTLRCNSGGDLYTYPSTTAPSCSFTTTSSLWHHRLGHPGPSSLAKLRSMSVISYNKRSACLCHACQLGKHVRLPFSHSTSINHAPFDLLHCDVWTSPMLSNFGFKYYLIILDNYSHYCWSFPLRHKSEVHHHMIEFIAYAQNQFGTTPKSFQADNGTEVVNHTTTSSGLPTTPSAPCSSMCPCHLHTGLTPSQQQHTSSIGAPLYKTTYLTKYFTTHS